MNVLRRIRGALPSSWFTDIDYDRTQDIDFTADYDPNEPRVSKGSPGGGQWTAGGGGAGAGPVPQLTKYAGPVGAKFKKQVEAHLSEMLNSTATPEEVKSKVTKMAAQMQAEAGNFKSSNVAGYINQLLAHLEKSHGLSPGALGKAVKKKDDGLAITPPSEAEIEKMAAALGPPDIEAPTAPAPAAPEPVAAPSFTEPAEPAPAALTPPAGGHPALSQIEEIAGNKWGADEKLAWINALAADIPSDDIPSQAYVQSQIAKLGGAAQAPEPAKPAPAEPAPEPEPGTLPEPVLATQKKIYDIVNGPGTNAEKIAQIEAKLVNIAHPPNVEYAEQAITLLEDKTGPVGAAASIAADPGPPKEAEPTGPEPQTDIQKAIVAAAQTPGNSSTKFWAMQKVVENAGLAPDDASLKFAQAWANSLYGGAGSTLEPSSKAASLAPPGVEQTPEEQTALVNALPAPHPFKSSTQGAMWAIASDPSLTVEGKTAQIEQMKATMAFPEDQDYGQKLIDVLKGGAAPTAAETLPIPSQAATAPSTFATDPTGLPLPDAGDITTQHLLYEVATNPKLTQAEKIAQIKQDLATGYSFKGNEDYANQLMAALGAPAAPATAAATTPTPAGAPVGPAYYNKLLAPDEQMWLEKSLPLPSGPSAEQTMWEAAYEPNDTATQKIAKIASLINGTANVGSKEYGDDLINFLKGVMKPGHIAAPVPTTATGASQPADFPKPPYAAVGNDTFIKNLTDLATNGPNTAAQLQDYVNNKVSLGDVVEGNEFHEYAKQIIAWKQAQEGGAQPAATPAPTAPVMPQNVPPMQQTYVNEIQAIGGNPNLSPAEKIGKINSIYSNSGYFSNSAVGQHQQAWIKHLGQQASTQTNQPAPTIPMHNYTNKQQSMYNVATDPTKGVAEKINLMQGIGAFSGEDVAYYNSVVAALGGASSGTSTTSPMPPPPATPMVVVPIIPMYAGTSATIQAKIYKAAMQPGASVAQKLANVQAITSNIWKNKNYKYKVIQALQAAQKAAPPAVAPTAPPANLAQPEPGSNTQSLMFSVANQPTSDPKPLSNPEKIAEITKILANSSGGAGGKAETYANSLITALGGQATTKTAAVAAQTTAAPTSTLGGIQKPSGPAPGSPGGPPLKHANAKAIARGEKIWNAAKKITGYNQPESGVVAPSVKKDFWSTVPSHIRAVVKDYTDSGSTEINGALRDLSTATPNVAKKIQGMEEAFDMPSAKVTEDVVLTRGLDMPQKEIDAYKNGLKFGIPTHYIMQGYGSSSMDPTTPAFSQRHVWLEMVIRKGTPALGVAAISSHPENELLLEHGQMFDIHEIREEGGKVKIRMVSIPKADTGDRAWRLIH